MSIVDRIRQLQTDLEKEAELDEAARKIAAKNKEEADQEFQERFEIVFKESHIIDSLQKIKDELLPKGELQVDDTRATLLFNDVSDHFIKAFATYQMNPTREVFLAIQGSDTITLKNNKWRDGSEVESALASAFLNPAVPRPPVEPKHWDE